MRQRFDPTTLYSPQRARSVWLGRDLMRKIQDRLLTTERPDPAIKDPIELRPVLSLTCDIDAMVKEPNYINDSTITYSANAGWKALWSCPDDEIADVRSFSIDSQSAARTMTALAINESDAVTTGPTILAQGASQTIESYNHTTNRLLPGLLYPGETIHVYFDVNVAGGTFVFRMRYIRLKTTEVPL